MKMLLKACVVCLSVFCCAALVAAPTYNKDSRKGMAKEDTVYEDDSCCPKVKKKVECEEVVTPCPPCCPEADCCGQNPCYPKCEPKPCGPKCK